MKLFTHRSQNRSASQPASAGLYVSPFEQFLNQYKSSNPDTDRQQMEGRALLWDKMPDFDATTAEPYGNDKLSQPSYVYYSNVV